MKAFLLGFFGILFMSPFNISGEFFIASDIPAFLEHTRKVMYLDDDQMVVINSEVEFIDIKTTSQGILQVKAVRIRKLLEQLPKNKSNTGPSLRHLP